MTSQSNTPRPTRLERKRMNRLARVNAAAADEDQGVAYLTAAFDFWRAMCKQAALDDRPAHRRRLAELLTNDALEWMDPASTPINYTRMEHVA